MSARAVKHSPAGQGSRPRARRRAQRPDGEIEDPETLRQAVSRFAYRGPERIRSLVARSPVAVLVADDRACYVAANEAACALTGYSESELVGMSLPDITAQVDASVADRLWTAFVDHERQRGDFALRLKDGSAAIVRYDALANVAPGLHVSFLRPIASLGRPPASGRRRAPGGQGSRTPDQGGATRRVRRPRSRSTS